jgi:hypothetical protein
MKDDVVTSVPELIFILLYATYIIKKEGFASLFFNLSHNKLKL